jgi:hypothetical protein
LLVCYRDNPQGLRAHLADKMLLAISDQPRIDRLALVTRFLGWVPPDP